MPQHGKCMACITSACLCCHCVTSLVMRVVLTAYTGIVHVDGAPLWSSQPRRRDVQIREFWCVCWCYGKNIVISKFVWGKLFLTASFFHDAVAFPTLSCQVVSFQNCCPDLQLPFTLNFVYTIFHVSLSHIFFRNSAQARFSIGSIKNMGL